jgi:glycerol-3-phosphate cytidylyltransferase-like family protein
MIVAVSDSFDDLRAPGVRFLEEASRLGQVTAYLWSDRLVERFSGRPPKFPQAERYYYLSAIRYVNQVVMVDDLPGSGVFPSGARMDLTAAPGEDHPAAAYCRQQGLRWVLIGPEQTRGFPLPPAMDRVRTPGRKKVLVTGCYDWLHSGHVRFFEEAAGYGDANVTHLKGEGHPLFPQDLRRYMAGSIRYVHQALITTGWGWMDAEPEINELQPDIYLVNEDGDKPQKRAFCAQHGLEYVVLKRLPKEGLQRRSSTDLRGY